MKLRIARKMDQKPRHAGRWLDERARKRRDKRPWNKTYSVEQLKRAEIRLFKSWRKACPPHKVPDWAGTEHEHKLARSLTPDFFRGNRVHARWTRQQYGNRLAREKRKTS